METVVRFTAQDWARSRFVRSRLWEVVQAVRVLVIPQMQQLHRPWLSGLDVAGLTRRLPVLVALNPANGWVPDFLAPPPQTSTGSLDDELAQVAAYPVHDVAADLRRGLRSHPGARRAAILEPLINDPAEALDRIVGELNLAWRVLLEPSWHRIDELITADIAYRGAEITREGMAAALEDLSVDVRRTVDTLRVRRGDAISIELAGRGLALMPSAFVWPFAVVVHEGGWSPTLAYPARGVAAMWTDPPRPADALAVLLGTTRAALLADLAEARSTSELSSRHGLAPATVSEHLAALANADLLTRRRDHRAVRYRRTPLADRLVRSAGSTTDR